MAKIYSMSDIHGYYDIMMKNLDLIDLSDDGSKLVLCGDYIDYGPDSCKVLYKVKDLMDQYPGKVIALKGNHETMFLDFLKAEDNDMWNIDWLGTDRDFSTINTFISTSTKDKIDKIKVEWSHQEFLFQAAKVIKEDILKNHKELIQWLESLPFYYETDTQIYVHAGIDEEAKEYWMYGTPEDYYVSKYPATFGKYYKDIIAGHIGTRSLANDNDFNSVFWDKKSHYYIDGTVKVSGKIPLLVYDLDEKRYSQA